MNKKILFINIISSYFIVIHSEEASHPEKKTIFGEIINSRLTDKLSEENQEKTKQNKFAFRFPWLNSKSEFLQSKIESSILTGKPKNLQPYLQSITDKNFDPENHLEIDQLLACYATAVNKQTTDFKKLTLFEEFIKYCKERNISFESYFDKNDLLHIKLSALKLLNPRYLELFKIAFNIDSAVSEELSNSMQSQKERYCNPTFKHVFKKECNLCSEYEHILHNALAQLPKKIDNEDE